MARGRTPIVTALATVLLGGALTPRAERVDAAVLVPNSIVVTNAQDAGAGSLRQAMLSANANPDPDAITFAIAGPGPFVIALQSPLPVVSHPVVIDGLTQAGAMTQAPQVFVDGAAMQRGRTRGQAPGFEILTSGTTIRGMGIGRFPGPGVYIGPRADGNRIESCVISGNTGDGILIAGGSRSTVSDNRIGTTPDGLGALPNGGNGVTLSGGASGMTLQSNLISGNDGWGIDLQAGEAQVPVSATTIRRNVIGLGLNSAVLDRGAAGDTYSSAAGDHGPRRRGNLGGGIRAAGSDGTIIGPGNVVSGNTLHGITLEGSGAMPPVIQGNVIGTDATGLLARGNVLDGIRVAAANTRVGGRAAGEGNVISGNLKDGIEILSNGVTVEGNYIGTDITGMAAIGNGPMLDTSLDGWHSGVAIDGSSRVTVGSSDLAGRNLISGNTIGLLARGSDRLRVEGNYIGTNRDLSGYLPNGLGSGPGGIALYGGSGASILGNNISGNTGSGGGIYTGNGPVGAKVAQNTISHNTGPGISVRGGDGINGAPLAIITITENAIFGNTGIGIDHGGDGPTPNHPVVIAVINGATTSMDFRLAGPAGTYTIEFFSGSSCGAAEHMVGGASEGIGRHRIDLGSLLPIDTWVVATATDAAGNTSELSACRQVRPGPAFTWWMSQGPGEVATTNLGRENGVAQFTYQHNGDQAAPLPDGPSSGEWSFTTVASGTGVISLDWSWAGFHSFFQVTARLEAFVNHDGKDVSVIQLVDAGPVDCCSSPSGGFSYTGTTTVAVGSGDTYGFRLRGSHFDAAKVLRGTFDVIVGIDGGTRRPGPDASGPGSAR